MKIYKQVGGKRGEENWITAQLSDPWNTQCKKISEQWLPGTKPNRERNEIKGKITLAPQNRTRRGQTQWAHVMTFIQLGYFCRHMYAPIWKTPPQVSFPRVSRRARRCRGRVHSPGAVQILFVLPGILYSCYIPVHPADWSDETDCQCIHPLHSKNKHSRGWAMQSLLSDALRVAWLVGLRCKLSPEIRSVSAPCFRNNSPSFDNTTILQEKTFSIIQCLFITQK